MSVDTDLYGPSDVDKKRKSHQDQSENRIRLSAPPRSRQDAE